MAYEIPGLPFTLVAGVDLRTSQYLAVACDTTTGFAEPPAAGAAIAGILQNAPNVDEESWVMRSGVSKVVAGAILTPGIEVEIAATGKAIVKATGIAVGYVLQGAQVDEIASIFIY
jgi:hypothetical protein